MRARCVEYADTRAVVRREASATMEAIARDMEFVDEVIIVLVERGYHPIAAAELVYRDRHTDPRRRAERVAEEIEKRYPAWAIDQERLAKAIAPLMYRDTKEPTP